MKKFPKPWFRPARGVWYVTLSGRQHNLGPDKAAAFARYQQLLAESSKSSPHETASSDSLAVLIDAFLDWVHRHRSPDTYAWYQYRLQRFLKRHPRLRPSEVRPYHVQEWVDGYSFSKNSRRNYMRTVKRCFSWATRQGYLDRNPVAGLELPAAERREVAMSQADLDALLSSIRDETLRDLLTVTIETGCRPQESLRVEARHVDLTHQRWVFPQSESKNKRTARVI